MIFFNRGAQPHWLAAKWQKWGVRWQMKIAANSSVKFQWATYKRTRVNKILVQSLASSSINHCCYCDGFPLGAMSQKTIDHFFPKSSHPLLAYNWDNLFIACNVCQEKKAENAPNNVLRPDDVSYSFDRYFNLDFFDGKILANPTSSPADQVLARNTIEYFGLNLFGRPEARQIRIKTIGLTGLALNNQSYRFIPA